MPTKPDRNSSHLAGEYFVAAELYKRGYSVALTLGNAKAIDLYAEHGAKTVNVQVKAIQRRKNVGWPVMRDRVLPRIVYVFVVLNEPGVPPDYFMCTSTEAKSKVKQYATRGIIQVTSLNSDEYRDRWDKIARAIA